MSLFYNEEILNQFKIILKNLLNQLPYPINLRLSDYILKKSGKMFRPMLLIQSANLLGANKEQLELSFIAGAIVEMLHNASLIHDDLIDGSPKRRGRETYHNQYGIQKAISDADILWAFALTHGEKFVKDWILYLLDNIYIVNKGNSKELEIRLNKNYEFTKEDVIEIMRMKTAIVFYACVNGVCMIVDRKDLGKKLEPCLTNAGIGFQLQDDILDIISDYKIFGKQNYWDVQESKPNLFLYYALQTEYKNKIRKIYSKPIGMKTGDEVKFIINIFKKNIDKITEEKDEFIKLALQQLNKIKAGTIDTIEQSFLIELGKVLNILGNRKK